MLTAGGRLLPPALGGSGWLSFLLCPCGSGWWVPAVWMCCESTQRTICVINAFRRLFGSWAVYLTACTL